MGEPGQINDQRRFVPAPGYTQIPNVIFDEYILECSGSEWQVLTMIARRTFGWQVEERLLTTGDLADLTGLSRQAVSSALNELRRKGMINRRHHRSNQWYYGIPVKKVDTVKNLGSPKNRQPSAPECQKNRHPLIRKESKEGKKEGGKAASVRKANKKQSAGSDFMPQDEADRVVVELYEKWREETGQPANTRLTVKRAGQARQRLREQAKGCPPETALADARSAMLEALEGWINSPWHREREAFDWETLFRSYDKVEMLRARRREQLAKSNGNGKKDFSAYDSQVENA